MGGGRIEPGRLNIDWNRRLKRRSNRGDENNSPHYLLTEFWMAMATEDLRGPLNLVLSQAQKHP
jgi:hypothetical protein